MAHHPTSDLDGWLDKTERILAKGNILQLDLAGQQGDGELVRVEVLEIFAEIVVEEPCC